MVNKLSVASFVFLIAVQVFLGPVQARAQSFTIINFTPCIQYIEIQHSSGRFISNLTPNGQRIKNDAKGSGITRIQAGPTRAVDSCCYRRKANLYPNLSGNTWRVEIHSDRLKVVDGDNGWVEVVNHAGGFNTCNLGGSSALGQGSSGTMPDEIPKGH